jgi:hypothetical protein
VFPPRRLVSSRHQFATEPYFALQQAGAPAFTEQLLTAPVALSREQQPFSTQQPPATQHVGQAQLSPQHAAQSAQQSQHAAFEPALAVSDSPPRLSTVPTNANERKRDMKFLRTWFVLETDHPRRHDERFVPA